MTALQLQNIIKQQMSKRKCFNFSKNMVPIWFWIFYDKINTIPHSTFYRSDKPRGMIISASKSGTAFLLNFLVIYHKLTTYTNEDYYPFKKENINDWQNKWTHKKAFSNFQRKFLFPIGKRVGKLLVKISKLTKNSNLTGPWCASRNKNL